MSQNTPQFRSWLGIPYATAKRFRKPTVVPFDSDLPYDKKGPASIQVGDTSWLDLESGTSEDCLNLNVWAPSDAKGPLLWSCIYMVGDLNTVQTHKSHPIYLV
ncbi:carboxylesterase family protein [Terribacillus saccharophilus]|uniref:carboxylesterase family protein n=1 Tax=Terribacillus saccharophilus TaxID=361277 RepID=UPI0039837A12